MRVIHATAAIFLFALGAFAAAEARADITGSKSESGPSRTLRIVTLAPHLAELVFAAGAGEFLVGVSAYSDFPDEVSDLPVVGDAFVIDQEQLALLRPSLLLAWQSGTPQHVVDELSNQGYRVEVIQTQSLEDIARGLERIGALTGKSAIARQAANDFRQALDSLASRYSEARPIRVFYQIQKRPIYTIGGEHYVSELIEHCGGQNIFSDLDNLAPLVAVEAVIERNPEMMLVSSDTGGEALSEWDRWPQLAANRYENRYVLPADEIGRPTLRVLTAGEALCKVMQKARAKMRGDD